MTYSTGFWCGHCEVRHDVQEECSYISAKFDSDKPRWDLLPHTVEAVVDVMTFGAKKYAENSWQKVKNGKTRYLAAAFRHLFARLKGEILDESGLPHTAHAAANMLFVAWFDQKEN